MYKGNVFWQISALLHQEQNRATRKVNLRMSILSSSPTDSRMAAVNTRCRALPCSNKALEKYMKPSRPVTSQKWNRHE